MYTCTYISCRKKVWVIKLLLRSLINLWRNSLKLIVNNYLLFEVCHLLLFLRINHIEHIAFAWISSQWRNYRNVKVRATTNSKLDDSVENTTVYSLSSLFILFIFCPFYSRCTRPRSTYVMCWIEWCCSFMLFPTGLRQLSTNRRKTEVFPKWANTMKMLVSLPRQWWRAQSCRLVINGE